MRALGRVIVALTITGLLGGVIAIGLALLYRYNKTPLPTMDQCVARVQEADVSLDLEQTLNASIIVGVSTQRSLVPRAATIALATVYQESGVRNLDYGDRDSLGLFQQRPSQGWGSPAEIMDPYYSAGAFYDVLVTIPDWESGNVNDVAQAVQRSGYPDAYARHVEKARRLASSLTGQTPASFSCVVRDPPPGDPAGLAAFLEKTLPPTVTVTHDATRVSIATPDNRIAWSAAQISVAQLGRFGLSGVEIGGRTWTPSPTSLADWQGEETNATTVTVRFDTGSPTPTPVR
ncbi:MAG: hypothetical protein ACK5LN_04855 [Propioniciclava sp.]